MKFDLRRSRIYLNVTLSGVSFARIKLVKAHCNPLEREGEFIPFIRYNDGHYDTYDSVKDVNIYLRP